MKKRNLWVHCTLVCAIAVMAFSCKKELTAQKSPTTSSLATKNDSNFVSLDMAIAAAKQATNSHLTNSIIKGEVIDAATGTQEKEILDYSPYPNDQNPSLYIINYNGGGFVVIPADKRVEPILAFSNKGYFSLSDALPGGLSDWLKADDKNMQVLRKNTFLKTPVGVKNLWMEFKLPATNNGGKTIDVAQPPPPPCEPTYTSQQVGPLLTTTWAQGVPYNQNSLVPPGSYAFGGGICPTGCVPTAMAQVMYYWKYPATYNWSIMPLTSNSYTAAGETEVARLMYNAGRSVGLVYGSNGSAPASTSNSVTANGLKSSYFGYTSATGANYNNSTSYPTVVSNLNANEPVILSGATSSAAHEWVCDGYLQTYSTTCATSTSPATGMGYLYFDMNWGWNEAGVSTNVDGFYDFNQWEVYNGPTLEYFYTQLEFTYNIHP